MNALFCGQCGLQIPLDSIFCPMCGFRTDALASGPMMPGAMAPQISGPRAPAPGPMPPQMSGPNAPVPGSMAPTSGARRTPVHLARVSEPLAPPAPALAPGPIPITRKPARIALGSLLVGVAAVLALSILLGSWSDEVVVGGAMGGIGLALAGIGLILTGARHRAQAHVRCRGCARPVLAWKGAFGLHCPLAPHYARVNWFMVALTALFWAGLVVVGLTTIWLAV